VIAASPGIHSTRKQRGAVLVVALIFLVVMTMLILASIRGTVMQERMASNLYDRSLAFQAAEAALRDGERFVLETPPKPAAIGCTAGTCSKPEAGDTPVWLDEDVWDDAHDADVEIGDLPVPPQYIVELLADDMPEVNICESTAIDPDAPCFAGPEGLRYRITARSGEEGRAVVVLQSVFAVPKPAGW